jgi:hypothetical protein
MLGECQPKRNVVYEMQVAIARANLDRHVQEVLKASAEWRAEHGEPAEALYALLRELFDRNSPIETWREWREESGHALADEW